jgi:hypothetical protein
LGGGTSCAHQVANFFLRLSSAYVLRLAKLIDETVLAYTIVANVIIIIVIVIIVNIIVNLLVLARNIFLFFQLRIGYNGT